MMLAIALYFAAVVWLGCGFYLIFRSRRSYNMNRYRMIIEYESPVRLTTWEDMTLEGPADEEMFSEAIGEMLDMDVKVFSVARLDKNNNPIQSPECEPVCMIESEDDLDEIFSNTNSTN